MRPWLLISLALLRQSVEAGFLPRPTGKYHIGTVQHVLNHTTTQDPTAPSGVGQDVLVTFYYPTLVKTNHTSRYIPKELAKIYETAYGYPADSLANETTKIQPDAPMLTETIAFPTVVFGPGGAGPPSNCYTALLSELASRGYTIAALDHPYEQPFLQYPNGSGIFGLSPSFAGSLAYYEQVYDFRIGDNIAFLDALPQLVKTHNYPFNTTHTILVGHSLGGAAALGTTRQLKSSRILGAINLDGTLFGAPNSSDATLADLQKPVLMFGNGAPHNFYTDRSWLTFPLAQTGWWREVSVTGSLHLDFSDVVFWKRFNGSATPEIGLIEGRRMVGIVSTYVAAFFDKLKGEKGTLFDGPSPSWPEVVFQGGRG